MFRGLSVPVFPALLPPLLTVDDEELARVVGHWGEDALHAYGQPGLHGIAIDGKTVRGSQGEQLPAVHLISALSQPLQVVLGQVEVGEHTNEITGVRPGHPSG
jgi:hypothetical protein